MQNEENMSLPADNPCPQVHEDIPAEKKKASFWEKFSSVKYLLWCFFLPAVLMWVIYIAMNVYPFGEESVLVLDLNGQYVYYFEALRRLLHGEGSFLYSFGRALGGEFLGIFAYYLASPFSFIVGLFPKAMITEALLTMFLLKTGLCGLHFGIYLHKTRDRNPVAVVIFSTMYALCAYAVVQQHNTMWIDNLIFLPLILLGIEEMIRFGKYKLFVVCLSLALFSNYYIGYMMCIFVAVYFFYYYFSRTPEERNPHGVKHHFLRSFGRIAIFSLLVICICSAILLPAYYSLTFGKTTFSDPSFALTQKFDFLDMLSKMYFGSYDTVRPEGLPFLYCGMLTFILVPLYFFAPHVRLREKIATGFLVIFFVIGFNASTLDLIWHGFQRPNWLNYRQSFMLCFIFLIMAYKAFEGLKAMGFRYAVASTGVIAGLLIIMQKIGYKNLPDFTAVWPSLIFCALYLFLLRACTMDSKNTRQTAALVMAILVSLEMFCAGLANTTAMDKDVIYSSRTSYRSFIDRVQPIADDVKEMDDSFYRMEKTVHRKTNDNLSLGLRGLSNSTSTLNAKVVALLKGMGMASKSHWSKYVGSTPVLDSLMNVKYVIAEDAGTISPLYNEILRDEENTLSVYENPYVLSLAFGVSPDTANFLFDDTRFDSPFVRMNHLITALLGEDETVEIFHEAKVINTEYINCSSSSVAGHRKYTPKDSSTSATLRYTVRVDSGDLLYCYIPSEYPREVELKLNNKSVGKHMGNETHAIKSLGHFEVGEEITISATLQDKDLYITTGASYFYYFDEAAYKDAMARLSTSQYVIKEYTEDSFTGTIHVAAGQEMIYTSIPYDAGWVVKIDGAIVETEEIVGALMGFRTTPGEHTLEMEYRPACVTYGTWISAGGLSVFAVICLGGWLNRKKKQKSIDVRSEI